MPDDIRHTDADAFQFIHEHIDSVPQLEGLVLLWESRPKAWTCEELAARLYIPPEACDGVLRELIRLGFVMPSSGTPERYAYFSQSPDQDELMRGVHTTYRQQLVRVSHMVHSKASSAIREFARAFRFKKEPGK